MLVAVALRDRENIRTCSNLAVSWKKHLKWPTVTRHQLICVCVVRSIRDTLLSKSGIIPTKLNFVFEFTLDKFESKYISTLYLLPITSKNVSKKLASRPLESFLSNIHNALSRNRHKTGTRKWNETNCTQHRQVRWPQSALRLQRFIFDLVFLFGIIFISFK